MSLVGSSWRIQNNNLSLQESQLTSISHFIIKSKSKVGKSQTFANKQTKKRKECEENVERKVKMTKYWKFISEAHELRRERGWRRVVCCVPSGTYSDKQSIRDEGRGRECAELSVFPLLFFPQWNCKKPMKNGLPPWNIAFAHDFGGENERHLQTEINVTQANVFVFVIFFEMFNKLWVHEIVWKSFSFFICCYQLKTEKTKNFSAKDGNKNHFIKLRRKWRERETLRTFPVNL